MRLPRTALASMALAASVTIAFGMAATFGFLEFEDFDFVTGNPRVTAGLGIDGVRWAFTTTHTANWYPLTWLSHMADWSLFGPAAAGHHVVSIALHALAAVLLFRWLSGATGAPGRSLFAALAWALHPQRVESVAWIASRKDVLNGVLFFLALLAWTGWVRTRRRRDGMLALLAFGASLLAKPASVTLPVLLLVLDGWPYGRWGREAARRLVLEKLPFFGLAALSGLVTLAANRAGWAGGPAPELSFAERLATAAVSCASYLRDAAWPLGLAAAYPVDPAPAGAVLLGAALVLVAISAAALALRRPAPWLGAGWLWFLVALAPVAGWISFGAQTRADRLTYLPAAGLAWIAAWGSDALLARAGLRRFRWAAWCAAALLLALLSVRQVGCWRDDRALFTRAVAISPRSALAQYGLGSTILRGPPEGAPGAEGPLRAALAIDPGLADAHYALGLVLLNTGRAAEAVGSLSAAARLKPGSARYRSDLGVALARTGRPREAAAEWERALALDPALEDARRNLQQFRQRAEE
jgi:hypothetical protein